jgi:hypothetical protein
MTEDEAKTKICCGPPQVAAQMMRAMMRALPAYCAGSACMAWVQTDNEAPPSKEGDPEPVYKPAGRCGLAGRP